MPDIYVLRVKLLHQKRIYRDIAISGNTKLYKLAQEITRAFDFYFDHAFGFYSEVSHNYYDSSERYELFVDMEGADHDAQAKSVKKTAVSGVFHAKKQKMLFLFDYGDEWLFEIEVVNIGEGEKGTKYPCVVKSSGTAPPQYPDYDEEEEEEEDEEEEDEEETGISSPLQLGLLPPGTAKKAELINSLMQILGNADNLSPRELAARTKDFFAGEFEHSLPEIDRLEMEEEKVAVPLSPNEKKLVKYFEGTQTPTEAMLELWIHEKWVSNETNFPLLRRYMRQGNAQLEKLLLSGLKQNPGFVELVQDMMDMYEYKPENADRSTLINALVAACDAEKDVVIFEDFLMMLMEQFEDGLPGEMCDAMETRYKAEKKKYKCFCRLAGKSK